MSNLSQTLNKYADVKQKLLSLQKEETKLKEKIHRMMDRNNTDELEDGQYLCVRRHQARESIQKKDVPSDIWARYRNVSEYSVLMLKERR